MSCFFFVDRKFTSSFGGHPFVTVLVSRSPWNDVWFIDQFVWLKGPVQWKQKLKIIRRWLFKCSNVLWHVAVKDPRANDYTFQHWEMQWLNASRLSKSISERVQYRHQSQSSEALYYILSKPMSRTVRASCYRLPKSISRWNMIHTFNINLM